MKLEHVIWCEMNIALPAQMQVILLCIVFHLPFAQRCTRSSCGSPAIPPFQHSAHLGAISKPPWLFTEPFSKVSEYIHEHSPNHYFTGDLPHRGEREPFPLTFYLLPSNQFFLTTQRLPSSLMAFTFSKAFSEKPSCKLYGNLSRHPQLRLTTNLEASTDHMLKTYSLSPGYSIHSFLEYK